jgi:hypothetical protein
MSLDIQRVIREIQPAAAAIDRFQTEADQLRGNRELRPEVIRQRFQAAADTARATVVSAFNQALTTAEAAAQQAPPPAPRLDAAGWYASELPALSSSELADLVATVAASGSRPQQLEVFRIAEAAFCSRGEVRPLQQVIDLQEATELRNLLRQLRQLSLQLMTNAERGRINGVAPTVLATHLQEFVARHGPEPVAEPGVR